MAEAAAVEALATRVKELLWVVLDAVPAELVQWSLMLVRLLHAADTFPRGGLYDGHYALQAALRYELLWLPLAARAQAVRKPLLVPPLDVAAVWLLHRCTEPDSYPEDCLALLGSTLDPSPSQAFRFGGSHAYTQCESAEERQAWSSREAWDAAYVHGQAVFGAADSTNSPALQSPRASAAVEVPGTGTGAGGKKKPREAAAAAEGWARKRRSSSGSSDGGGGSFAAASAAAAMAASPRSVGSSSTAAATSRRGGGGGRNRFQGAFWPPAPPGSRWDLTRKRLDAVLTVTGSGSGGGTGEGRGRLADMLAGRMGELCPLLHSLLRPAYLDPDVLAQALQRYCRFLMLQGMHPSVPLVPTTDIALMWVAHMSVPASYRATCRRLLGPRVIVPAPGVLRLADRGPAFEETRRLYEHHFGEVYDPPLTRAVPLATLHPLLSTPLAPFLAAFEADAPPPPPIAVRPVGTGAGATVQAPALSPQEKASGLHRCGAHALYLAYLLRRGHSRSAKSLLGLVFGQGHRRRAAVKYVANKTAGFREFLHLPHSDCHSYWRKLRMRTVDPDAVSGGATPTSGSQPDVDADAVTASAGRGLELGNIYGNGDDDGGGHSSSSDVETDTLRSRRGAAAARMTSNEATQSAAVGGGSGDSPSSASRRPAPSGLPTGAPRRMSWVDPVAGGGSGVAGSPRASASSGSSMATEPPAAAAAAGLPPRAPASSGGSSAAGGGGRPVAWEKPKRIALIVPLPHTTLTFRTSGGSAASGGGRWAAAVAMDSGDSSRRSSARETSSGAPSERPSHSAPAPSLPPPVAGQYSTAEVSLSQLPAMGPATEGGDAAGVDVAPTAAAITAPVPAMAPSTAQLGTDAAVVAAAAAAGAGLGIQAAAAAAREPYGSWVAPRSPAATQTTEQDPAQQQQFPGHLLRPGPGMAVLAGELSPQTNRKPSFERRRYDDGTDEWAYNNPHFVERMSAAGPLSPLSPLGQTPPPASAAFLEAAAAAAAKAGAAAAAIEAEGAAMAAADQDRAPFDAAAGGCPGGTGAPVGAVTSGFAQGTGSAALTETRGRAPSSSGEDAGGQTADNPAADAGGTGAFGTGGRPGHLRRLSRAYDTGPGSAANSVYMSCSTSRESLEDLDLDGGGGGIVAAAEVAAAGSLTVVTAAAASGDSDSGDGLPSLYGTPNAEFAAAVTTPFTMARRSEMDSSIGSGGGGGSEEAEHGSDADGGAGTAAAAVGPGRGSSGGLRTSRLSRVSTASAGTPPASTSTSAPAPTPVPVPATSIGPNSCTRATTTSGVAIAAAGTAVAGAAAGAGSRSQAAVAMPGNKSRSRLPGLPPRPSLNLAAPVSNSGGGGRSGATAGGGSGALKRSSGSYSLHDASYMTGLGGVASLVGSGEEAPAFATSLRERYTGGAASGGGGGNGSSNDRGRGSDGGSGSWGVRRTGSSRGDGTERGAASGASSAGARNGVGRAGSWGQQGLDRASSVGTQVARSSGSGGSLGSGGAGSSGSWDRGAAGHGNGPGGRGAGRVAQRVAELEQQMSG